MKEARDENMQIPNAADQPTNQPNEKTRQEKKQEERPGVKYNFPGRMPTPPDNRQWVKSSRASGLHDKKQAFGSSTPSMGAGPG